MQGAVNAVGNYYRHTKREDWGVGELLWEREGKRGYKFHDGATRVFTEPYWALLIASAPPPATETANATAPGLAEQVAYFLGSFPDGFDDGRWTKRHRASSGRPRKSDRAAALALAADKLSVQALDECIARAAWPEVLERVVEVLETTDLVTAKQLAPMRVFKAPEVVARSIREYLYGEDPVELRMDRVRAAFKRSGIRTVPWRVLTAMLAVARPVDFPFVRRAVYVDQAQKLARAAKIGPKPTGKAFRDCVSIALLIRDRLVAAGLTPRDLLDVSDFMWETLRPAARAAIEALYAERLTNAPAEAA